ncbi:MAG: TorF family putative porin [Hyphomonadaceae bacterium]
MRRFNSISIAMGAALISAAFGANAAHADTKFEAGSEGDTWLSGWGMEASMGVTSDYRYRGVSLSNGDAAWQGDLSFAHANGVYVYGWASSIADNGGDDIELMGAIGWAGAFFAEDLSIDLGLNTYVYPGVDDSNLLELAATVTRTWGDASFSSGIAYFPEQESLADLDDTYLHAGLEAPLGFWGVTGGLNLGWEEGAFADGKVDWSVGASIPINAFEMRLAYVGARDDAYAFADDAVVAELRYSLASE